MSGSEQDGPAGPRSSNQRWWTPGVVSIAAASFGSDAGHEITTSLLPTFLTSILHASPGALGAVEGTSEALVGLSKLAGGPLSSDLDRRSRTAAGGYLVTAAATGAIAAATAVWQVAILRGVAWAARGLRSPVRDSLLISLVPRAAYGRASGLERAGDNAGALVGPLLAAALVTTLGIRHGLIRAFIPGLVSAAAITVAAREARRTVTAPIGRRTLAVNVRSLHQAGLGRILARVAPFEIDNAATTLLILRATGLVEQGRSATAATSLAILLYAAHNACAMVTAVGAGRVIDRATPRVAFGVVTSLATQPTIADQTSSA